MANRTEAANPRDTGVNPSPTDSGRTRLRVVLAIVVVAVLAIGSGLWWYLRDDAPAKVDLGRAAASVTTVPGAKSASLPGTWTVDTSTGSFDFSSATGTFAGFRVQEDLSGIGSTTAVGRTGSVSGTMTIAGDTVTAAEFTVDLTTITTDRSQRDRRVQDALDTGQYPAATFTLTEPITLPADADSGTEIAVDVHGEFTVHGTTRSVVVPLQAKLVGDTIVVVGSVDLDFSDYGVTVPSAPVVLSVDDHGTMELQLLLTRS